jgi:WD40 repeat protein
MAFSRDGSFLAVGAQDAGIVIFNAATWSVEYLLRSHRDPIAGVAWSPIEPRLASMDSSGEIILWDMDAGQKVFSMPSGVPGSRLLKFSPDGQRLLVAGSGKAKVWDAARGYSLAKHPRPKGPDLALPHRDYHPGLRYIGPQFEPLIGIPRQPRETPPGETPAIPPAN